MHELASVLKQHILIGIINMLWLCTCGVIKDQLLHDIEKAIWYQRSVAGEDDQRFENVNQLIDSHLNTYSRYKGQDKLQLVARRMNCQSLNVAAKRNE